VNASPRRLPVVTLTFDLQNLIRFSVEAREYSVQVSSRLLKSFVRYCGNTICLDKQTNVVDGQPREMALSPTHRQPKKWRFRRHSWVANVQKRDKHTLQFWIRFVPSEMVPCFSQFLPLPVLKVVWKSLGGLPLTFYPLSLIPSHNINVAEGLS